MTGAATSRGAALWSRPVLAARFGPKPSVMTLEADAGERAAIAKAYGCLAVHDLRGELKLSRKGDDLRVSGMLLAEVDQPCVVTLEPVRALIREEVALVFAPPTERPARAGEAEEEDIGLADEDPPEALIDGRADLGEALLQFFALALDPYPRKPGAAFAQPEGADLAHPFAALARLKGGQ